MIPDANVVVRFLQIHDNADKNKIENPPPDAFVPWPRSNYTVGRVSGRVLCLTLEREGEREMVHLGSLLPLFFPL